MVEVRSIVGRLSVGQLLSEGVKDRFLVRGLRQRLLDGSGIEVPKGLRDIPKR